MFNKYSYNLSNFTTMRCHFVYKKDIPMPIYKNTLADIANTNKIAQYCYPTKASYFFQIVL